MKIIARGGKVVRITDSGDVRQQLDNINAVVIELQRYARNLRGVSSVMLNDGLYEMPEQNRKKGERK